MDEEAGKTVNFAPETFVSKRSTVSSEDRQVSMGSISNADFVTKTGSRRKQMYRQKSLQTKLAHNQSQNFDNNGNSSLRKKLQAQRQKFQYDWKAYSPDDASCWKYFRWFVTGSAADTHQTDEELLDSLSGLTRCLTLLRQYQADFGMPEAGGPKDQEYVLREVVRDLYGGGVPLFALEMVMQKAAEGLTGNANINWFLLPRKAFVFQPNLNVTSMFPISRGFNISKMDAMEVVAKRLCSFASNSAFGASNIPSRFPKPEELNQTLLRTESTRFGLGVDVECMPVPQAKDDDTQQEQAKGPGQTPAMAAAKEALAEEILELASATQGIFYFVNSKGYLDRVTNENSQIDEFWIISDTERELFSRLACMEAMRHIDEIGAMQKAGLAQNIYPAAVIVLFRVLGSATCCGFWFGGSWIDMLVAGLLAVVVAGVGEAKAISKQERAVFEVGASLLVGFIACLIALAWPDDTCFGAMALSAVIDILQGFRLVFAIMEIMSKQTVSGCADLLEGILTTGLIVYALQFGKSLALAVRGDDSDTQVSFCHNNISEWYYFLLVPAATLAWSGLFTPAYYDLVPMTLHGIVAFVVNFELDKAGVNANANNFVSAAVVAFLAGITSRFTGRQAAGNCLAGLYVLVPGAYMVKSLAGDSFFTDTMQRSLVIGMGAWTGSILCAPVLLGAATRGLPSSSTSSQNSSSDNRSSTREASNAGGTTLFS